MKNTVKRTACLLLSVSALLLSAQAQAQFQATATGNYLVPTESGASFSGGVWGGGLTLRYFVNPKLAFGVNGRYFSSSNSVSINFDPGTGVGGSLKSNQHLLMVTGQAEYFFSASALRPYAGLEAGLYSAAARLEITNGYQTMKLSDSGSNFGVAPKVGLQYGLSPAFGLNADVGYHIIFNKGETGKTLLLGAGAYFTFGRR